MDWSLFPNKKELQAQGKINPAYARGGFGKRLFPPVTCNSVLAHYMALGGAVSHAAFGIHVLNPSILPDFFPHSDLAVANALFFNSTLGVGLYVFHRKIMNKVSITTKVIYSIYGAVLFNFGSVLTWAATKVILPRNALVRSVFAILTSVSLLAIGCDYLRYVDSFTVDEEVE